MKFIHGAHHFESCLATWPHSSLRQCSEIGFDIKELQSKLKTNLLCGKSKLGKTFNMCSYLLAAEIKKIIWSL